MRALIGGEAQELSDIAHLLCVPPGPSEKVVTTPPTCRPSVARSIRVVRRTSRVCTARCSSKPVDGHWRQAVEVQARS
jgi:hypothetical protein